jgi:hypothetical protein
VNNFDSFRPITRRYFWDNYISCLTCIAVPEASGSSFGSGETMDVDIDPVYQAAGPSALDASVLEGSVALIWTAVPGAYAYVVYRSTEAEGPFTITSAGIVGESFIDVSPGTGNLYYRVTAIEPSFGETLPSPVASVTL